MNKGHFAFLLAATSLITISSYGNECSEALTMNRLALSAVQFPIEGNQTLEAFFVKAESYVDRSVNVGSQLVVFPELMMLDLLSTTSEISDREQLQTIAAEKTSLIFDRFAEMARDKGISILAGSSPRIRASDGAITNTAMFVSPEGKRVYQDKIFLTPDEVEWGWKPGEELNVFSTPWGRTVILICYDAEFSKVSNELAPFHPDVILVPSMTSDRNGFHRVRFSAHTRAVEHYAYVVHTGTVGGRGQEHEYFAQASVLGPQDGGFPSVIGEGQENQAQILSAVLDLKLLAEKRKSAGIYPAREQNNRKAPFRIVEK